jgi:TIR domain
MAKEDLKSKIFLSYAASDDVAPPFEDQVGFVTFLYRQLTFELRNFGESTDLIWFDRDRSTPGALVTAEARKALVDSDILLLVLSANWMASQSCLKELLTFVEHWQSKGDISERIVIVTKGPVEREHLPQLLEHQLEFTFYTRGDTGDASVHEFYWRGVHDAKRYFDVLLQLARHLANQVHILANKSSQPMESLRKLNRPEGRNGGVEQTRPGSSAQLRAPPSSLEFEFRSADRTKPEYWLHRVASERHLSPGDEPLVLVSFASEDQEWTNSLHSFLQLRIEELCDPNGGRYKLWNFSDAKAGTTPGDEFPEVIAEKMWRCRAAVILLSMNYFKSSFCRHIELPFLMWRWERHKLLCLPVKVGIVPIDRVRLPKYDGISRRIDLNDIIDDRQAALDFSASAHRDLNLKELKEAKLEAEIEKRFFGVSRRVEDFLKKVYNAYEED